MSRAREPIQIVPKGWGREVWIANGERYCGKILEIRKGKKCSLHFHKIKDESFYLRAGRLLLRVMTSAESPVEEFILEAGQCMDVPIGFVHQMEALEDSELYEFSSQHFDSDSHRLVREIRRRKPGIRSQGRSHGCRTIRDHTIGCWVRRVVTTAPRDRSVPSRRRRIVCNEGRLNDTA
jgi:mannose-6-phosphate isomerase-like protein (cupin superfamily)